MTADASPQFGSMRTSTFMPFPPFRSNIAKKGPPVYCFQTGGPPLGIFGLLPPQVSAAESVR